jgi:cephalosporin-C deacetylase
MRFRLVIVALVVSALAPCGLAEEEKAPGQGRVVTTLAAGNATGIFSDGDLVKAAATIVNETDQNVSGRIVWEVTDDRLDQRRLGYSRIRRVSRPGSPIKDVFEFDAVEDAPPGPGFIRFTCSFEPIQKEGAEPITGNKASFRLGFEHEKIESPLTREPDFDEFWAKTLDELKTIEASFSATPKPEKISAGHNVFELEMKSLGNLTIRGWLEVPKERKGPFPAVIRVPGYGQEMNPIGDAAPDGTIVLSLNIRGHGTSRENPESELQKDYWIRGLDAPSTYFYRGAYMDCVRAIDYLVTREDVDPKRIAITGGSQGGGLSLATAALDGRISACAADVPFLLNWVNYFKETKWPEMDAWIAQKEERTWESTLKNMSYFDVMNLADRIKCPVMVGIGLQDNICPPSTIFATYNKLAGDKSYRIYQSAQHDLPAEHHRFRWEWLNSQTGSK